MPRSAHLFLIVVILAPAAAQAQAAQPAATLPFRAGQWGVEFTPASHFPGVGVLKFRGNGRSAWFGDFHVDLAASEDRYEPAEGDTVRGPYERDEMRSNASIRAGLRRYRPITERSVGYTTFGLIAGGSVRTAEYGAEEEWYVDYTSWEGGAFAELGGAWMVTRNLSVGAAFQGTFTYGRATMWHGGSGRSTERRLALDVGQTRALVTVFF